MRRHWLPLALSAALVAGCGGDDEGTGDSRTYRLDVGQKLRVVGDEYSFSPDRVVVRGAGELVIALDNRGALAHNLKLVRGGRVVGGSPTFPGGQTRSGRVRVERGGYEMVCTVGNHADLGMTGTLEVR